MLGYWEICSTEEHARTWPGLWRRSWRSGAPHAPWHGRLLVREGHNHGDHRAPRLTIVLQLMAAVLVLRLIRITAKRTGWVLLALAVVLLALQRCLFFLG